ncbi:MAG: hypothetical protein GY834_03785 [Bacteroidetes bacterium]|nr:hypothetical protein [Bacteroidota bacterium]
MNFFLNFHTSFQDQHKYNSSADLGMIVAYGFSEAFDMDLSIPNSEGYKTVVVDPSQEWSFGAEFNQLLNVKNSEDKRGSNEIPGNDWSLSRNESQFIIDFEFSPVNEVKTSPNYQGWNPQNDSKRSVIGFLSKS